MHINVTARWLPWRSGWTDLICLSAAVIIAWYKYYLQTIWHNELQRFCHLFWRYWRQHLSIISILWYINWYEYLIVMFFGPVCLSKDNSLKFIKHLTLDLKLAYSITFISILKRQLIPSHDRKLYIRSSKSLVHSIQCSYHFLLRLISNLLLDHI